MVRWTFRLIDVRKYTAASLINADQALPARRPVLYESDERVDRLIDVAGRVRTAMHRS